MSLPSWLRHIQRQLLAPRLGAVRHRRTRNTLRTRLIERPSLERLEDRITPTGPTLTSLASFNGGNGANPYAGVVVDSSGNLYGTTVGGGASGVGTVFELVKGSSTITTLASFNGGNGANPYGSLNMDSSGNLYGTTSQGGASSRGTIFELAKGSGTITTLASFDGSTAAHPYDGGTPYAGLIMDGNGNLYGTTLAGGISNTGTIFELAKGSGTITTLDQFVGSNGASPYASLVMDSSGNLYGTTTEGAYLPPFSPVYGTIFELSPGSNGTTLTSFTGNTADNPDGGETPYAGLVMDGNGNLYGTTSAGGASGDGTVFELAKGSSTPITLASFNGGDGASPYAGLVMDSNGNLYGTTRAGGGSNDGTLFELPQGSGTITTLASFNGSNGSNVYAGLAMDSNGNLYGTTYGGGASGQGTIFEFNLRFAPYVTTNPTSQTVTAGGTATFTAAANGNPASTVQWQVSTDGGKHWSNVSGATSPTLTLNDVTTAMNGYQYAAVFTNSLGNAATDPVTLAVTSPTTIAAANATALFSNSAQNVTLTANVSSNAGPVNEGTVTFTLLQGSNTIGAATTSKTVSNGSASVSYALPAGTAVGTYTIDAVYNPGPDFTTNSDNTHTLTVQVAPSVTTNPVSQTVIVGGNVTFTAAANGNPTPAVQWQVSSDDGQTWADISNATSTTLTLTNVSFALNGDEYRAVFSNSRGTAPSNAATLTVHTPPAITSGNSAVFTVGQFGSFLVTTSGFPAPTITIVGVVPSGMTFTDNGNGTASIVGTPAAGSNGTYYIAFTADNGVVSDATQHFTLTVNSAPVSPPSPPPSPPPPPPSPNPAPPNVPVLLSLFNMLLPHTETVDANGITITDSLFGISLVEMYDDFGNLVSVTLFGFNITFLFV